MGHTLERHGNFAGALGQALSSSQIERNILPTPVIDQKLCSDIGFGPGLGINTLFRLSDRVANIVVWTASTMLLIQVLLMRWNIVIGGQLISNSERGIVFYQPGWLEKEGILISLLLLVLPIVVLYLLGRVFPFWQDDSPPAMCGGVSLEIDSCASTEL